MIGLTKDKEEITEKGNQRRKGHPWTFPSLIADINFTDNVLYIFELRKTLSKRGRFSNLLLYSFFFEYDKKSAAYFNFLTIIFFKH